MRLELNAVILAGGLGTRMRPITNHKPKPLVLYDGIPLVVRIIKNLNQHVSEITVATSYLSGQFEDIPYSYPNCRITSTTDSGNMIAAFMQCAKVYDEGFILGISSDVVFAPSLVQSAFQEWHPNPSAVHVFLTRSPLQTYKKWRWVIDANRLVDIEVDTTSTGYEKLFVVFPIKILKGYTTSFTSNLGTNECEFYGYENYNRGWIFLLKKLLERGVDVQATVLDGDIRNVNSLEDLVVTSKS